jgi:RimJ/RimL family protein N-acetyltransferase
VVTVPRFETDRLVLREFRAEDFEPMAAFYADPVSTFYGGPCGREDAWRKFAMYPGHWVLRGYGPWALEEKASGEFVGICGPYFPEGWFAPEITWALMPGRYGKGYATEAALRALRSAYEDFEWDTAVSVIAIENAASEAVAHRMGATRESLIDFRYGRAHVYRHCALDLLPGS